ncbi:Rtr1/RPAP2 family protein phosphatase [Aspergillus chevalieri]|uniref:RNA polymerase II subunit B1 CTD phosphatase RPAP2 homolog n=1 Tax=Aspergillus chevalieri TaxID=182096 RepID=A0A7R7ZM70_ASPCH|nr:uncharacterized protein ACHE_40139A [Aspergillus chevalieri]BCR87575.1 hypothetical protein ACHE_40139A [Aspergillus chevalieri]
MPVNQPPLRTSLPTTHAAASDSSRRQQKKPQDQSNSGVDPRHMAIALHHAHRIQAQKDTESLILDRILDLVAFPHSPTADPSSPSPEDARLFKNALFPFQPTDYDNLIQERNIEGLCGYGLCPREHRREEGGGMFRIRYGAKGSGPGGRGREMNIVPKEKLEMWCSDECAERAMYIRVQLAQEPVWERRGDDTRNKDLVLLEEGREQQGRGLKSGGNTATVGQVAGQLENMHMHGPEARDMAAQMQELSLRSQELALERGDSSTGAFQQGGRVGVQIMENENISHAVAPPQMRPEDIQGGSIEGYFPKPQM